MLVRSAVFVCGLSVFAAGAVAQDQVPPPPPQSQMGPPSGAGPHGRMMDPSARAQMLKQNLNLTDDQTSQVKTIFEDSRTKLEAMRSLSQDDRRSQRMSIRKGEQDKIQALLTPDQKTKYAAMQEQMRDRTRNGQGGPPAGDAAPPPPASPQI